MMRFVWRVSPPEREELRSGNVKPFVGSVRGASGVETALPALSDQVWKCMVSPGADAEQYPQDFRAARLCAIDG
jgi:hypothetical protein